MRLLRQSTAVTASVGPFLSPADGVTPLTALADQSVNARLVKNGTGGAFAAASWVHDGNGHYLVGLGTGDTGTLGTLRLDFSLPSTYAPVWEDFEILPAGVYDSLVAGSSVLPANLTQIDGNATAGNNATLNLKQLTVVNSGGDAIVATAAGGNGNGAVLTGFGAGDGLALLGGPTGGRGLHASGLTAAGARFEALGGNNNAVELQGAGSGDGLAATGGATGRGLHAAGGATSGAGALIAAQGGNSDGLTLTHVGTGKDLNATLGGDVAGKVLGGGASTITGVGAAIVVGVGLRQITVALVDQNAAPIANAIVTVMDATGTAFQVRKDTDTNGRVVVALDDATYQVRLAKAGVSFTVPQTLVVAGDATITYTGTTFAVLPPPAPPSNLCTIFTSGALTDASGAVLANRQVLFRAAVPEKAQGNTLGGGDVTVRTDANGQFSLNLLRGALVQLWMPEIGYRGTLFLVPDQATQDLGTWAPQPQ